MKLPMKWIGEYAAIPVDAKVYQDRMIWTGTAVEGLEYLGEEIEKVVVGRVLTVDKVEGSDHLHVCRVDAGQDTPLQIVCGAPNVAPGILVPVALDGARLPGGTKIKKGKLRGVVSEGMLCSATELNIPQELYPSVGDAGLLIFGEEYPLGADVKPIFGLDDTVVDFEILANRPDCLCALGIARETAVALGTEFREPAIKVEESDGNVNEYVKIRVEDSDFCPRYVARVVKNVRVKPSPLWLRRYLSGAGMRSINNVVDITNFVMLETGHPMHAFDLNKVRGGEIIVRKARVGETLRTLDGKVRELSGIELLICDGEGPTGVAGIMGGEESEITGETKTLMFECAAFQRAGTRLAARSLGMRTEASGRFEKGVSPMTALKAMQRACQMINELDAGDVVPGIIDIYPAPQAPQTVHASLRRVAARTGVDIPKETMVDILKRLHFGVTVSGDDIEVTVPDFRQDVEGEADLSEEVLRIFGYGAIPATRLRGETTPGGRSEAMRFRDALGTKLNGFGFFEVMNFSFIGTKALEKLNLAENDPRLAPLTLLNPLGEDTRVMRPTLAPGMLQTLALNMNRGNEKAWLYEIAAVFDPHRPTAENLPSEVPTLVLGMYGGGADFYTLRGMVQAVLAGHNIKAQVVPGGENYHHPGRCARLVAEGQILAVLGEVHPDVREAFDMPGRALLAEVDLAHLKALAQPAGEVKPLPRYPAVSRDLALVMAGSQPVGPVMEAMEKAAGVLMEECRMFDVYRGAQLGENKKSVAFSLSFRSNDHTLTENEIASAMDKVLKACAKEFDAVIRA